MTMLKMSRHRPETRAMTVSFGASEIILERALLRATEFPRALVNLRQVSLSPFGLGNERPLSGRKVHGVERKV